MIKTICVFCGSSTGESPVYAKRAEQLARFFLENNIHLVYGGANVGLMRVLADTMLKGNGYVMGVMPKNLVHREVAHLDLTEMHIVENMQERKALMAKLSDGFMTLPGAYGTFDELFEMLSWNQLHIVEKPVGLLNIKGFFDPLLKMLDDAVEEKFLRPEHRGILLAEEDEAILLKRMNEYKPVPAEKWIERLKEGKI
ncbi:MAG TPA: TIGR00730 family Rossman fold protein [Bacteroidales bacterium]|nr:TIGR00730 family Rossman fold protein [Bacteroidales bacterium]